MRLGEGKGGLKEQCHIVSLLIYTSCGETQANSNPSVAAADVFQKFLGTKELVSHCGYFFPRLNQVSKAHLFLPDTLPTIAACTEASRSDFSKSPVPSNVTFW